ncbi:MAG: DUF4389 domain-containing protein [Dehalococcoidia bacterium]
MNSQPMLRFDVEYPEHLSRLTTFFRGILAIPQLIVLYLLGAAAGVVTLIAWFAILFTGKYPLSLWNFSMMCMRWGARVGAYYLLMRDEYPPFGEGTYPVTFELDYPGSLSRWKIFLKGLFLIPHFILLYILIVVAMIVMLIAWFAIIITGKYPRGLFNFMVGVSRWGHRVNVYANLLTDAYPPFSMAPTGASNQGFATGAV